MQYTLGPRLRACIFNTIYICFNMCCCIFSSDTISFWPARDSGAACGVAISAVFSCMPKAEVDPS